jgi:AraC family transcriptional regulator of adaptative response / DNA-3-methyladenine glycosylase II
MIAPTVTTKANRELVCRGVQLILGGALNDGTEDGLGALLGVSARHLRRLFRTHLGATPDQLARFHRAQCACRLLDDTGLSVTEIASAAGYGSLRQFNRSFQQAFRASPSQLRAHRRSRGQLAIAAGLPLRLSYHGLLDWAALTHCLAAQAVPGVERVSTSCYRRTVMVGGDPGVLELRPGGPGHLVLVVHTRHWEELVHIAGRARHIASLDDDPGAAALFLASDQLIGPLVTARPGVRVPGCWDPFEVGVRAIVERHEPDAAASTQRLIRRIGRQVPGLEHFGLTHCFPPARAVAAVGPAELADIGLRSAAATAIVTFAKAVASKQLAFDRGAGLDRLVTALTAISGLDSHCAHYIALRAGEPDACPAIDMAVRRSGGMPGHTGPIQALSGNWRPWRALAATHLWLDGQSAAW